MAFSAKHEWSLGLAPKGGMLVRIQKKCIYIHFNKKVFLPHPDSLLLAHSMKVRKGESFCDLGAGSGIIAITAAKLGASEVFASDTNKSAIRNSIDNAELNSVKSRCVFRHGSWFRPFPRKKFDVIAANPPQIPGKGNEPRHFREATEAGDDGTAPTLFILKEAKKHLKKGGRLYIVLKEWMDWKKAIAEMKKLYKVKKAGETFSPVWTTDKARLGSIAKLVSSGKARFRMRRGKKYWKIYAFECKPR